MATVLNARHFRTHARNTYHGAKKLQDDSKPVPAAYLTQVAMECAFKARLLTLYNCARVTEFKDKQPVLWDKFFTGAGGHDLGELVKGTDMGRFFAARKEASLFNGPVWNRMKSQSPDKRPYSLRYGWESLSDSQALEELNVCDNFLRLLGA